MCFVNYVRAAYPLLWVKTYEESRVLVSFINEVKRDIKYQTFIWDIVEGLREVTIERGDFKQGNIVENSQNDPAFPLNWLDTLGNEKVILFLKDFTPYLQREFSDSTYIIRKIRNLIPKFKGMNKVLTIISPTIKIPLELDKEVTVVDFKLPTKNELKDLLRATCETTDSTYPENDDSIVNAASGMTIHEAENAYCLSLVEKQKYDEVVIRREKAAIVKKSGIIEVIPTEKYTLSDIGGLENLKVWLLDRKDSFSKEAVEFGIKPPKGLLMVGVPGSGKSLTAKACASALGRPLIRLDMGRVYGSFVGESEANMRKCLDIAEAIAPCVLWIDEMEKGLSGNKSGQEGHETTKRVFQELLTWMQDREADVFLVATANSVESLPPELLRAGRIDAIFWVDLPDDVQREEILKIHLKKINRDPAMFEKEMTLLVKACDGFTGAEIEVWLQEALNKSFKSKQQLNFKDMLSEVQAITPISKLSKVEIERAREWAKNRGCRMASRVHTVSENVQKARKLNLN